MNYHCVHADLNEFSLIIPDGFESDRSFSAEAWSQVCFVLVINLELVMAVIIHQFLVCAAP